MKRKVSPWLVLIPIVVCGLPFIGIPWGYYPSYGGSYGSTMRGLGVVHINHRFDPQDVVVGTHVSFKRDGRGMMKRVRKVQGGWVEAEGDNTSNGGSSSSYEFGWLRLPSALGPPPDPQPRTAPKEPILVDGIIDQMWDLYRLIRSFSPRGRMVNRISLEFAPNKYILAGNDMAAGVSSKIHVYQSARGLIFSAPAFDYASGAQRPVEWRNARFVYKPANRSHLYAIFDPAVPVGPARQYEFDALDTLPMTQSGDELLGKVILRPGAIINFTRSRQVSVDDQWETHTVPIVSADRGKPIVCSMATSICVQRELRNVGQGACTVSCYK